MEMLDLLENIRVEEASVAKLFGGEGVGVHAAQKASRAGYLKKLAEATQFVADVLAGARPVYQLREAMTTSDFPLLFGDIIDRQLWGNYTAYPQVWPSYCKRATVSDFRLVQRFVVNGSEGILTEVPQQTDYPESVLSDGHYSYAVRKYGRRIPFSWETMVNDDLDALKDIPARFGKAAARSEERFATALHVDANGPLAAVYAVGNRNIVSSALVTGPGYTVNPQLSIVALQEAMAVMATQLDTDSQPIFIDALTLEVPPALEIVALNILNAEQIWVQQNITAAATPGAAMQQLIANNWMKGRVKLAVNPYLPIVTTVGTVGSTEWFLHANPSVGRPAFEMGFLRGHETPEVFIKMPNQQRVGGGVNPMDGDFDTDSIEYKVRHVFGGVAGDVRMTVASTGQNA